MVNEFSNQQKLSRVAGVPTPGPAHSFCWVDNQKSMGKIVLGFDNGLINMYDANAILDGSQALTGKVYKLSSTENITTIGWRRSF